VTLRVNANVTYRIVDARKAVSSSDDVRQALYRETQLALRAVIGARELDAFLVGKDTVGQEIEQAVRQRAGELGGDRQVKRAHLGVEFGPTWG